MFVIRRETWLFPQPVRVAVTAITGLLDGSIEPSISKVENLAPAASTTALRASM